VFGIDLMAADKAQPNSWALGASQVLEVLLVLVDPPVQVGPLEACEVLLLLVVLMAQQVLLVLVVHWDQKLHLVSMDLSCVQQMEGQQLLDLVMEGQRPSRATWEQKSLEFLDKAREPCLVLVERGSLDTQQETWIRPWAQARPWALTWNAF
jgi:hypothetical protein